MAPTQKYKPALTRKYMWDKLDTLPSGLSIYKG